MPKDSAPTDLLGMPLLPMRDRRGRKPTKYAPQVYETVEVLAAANLSQEEISDAVGISGPSLRKSFRKQLDQGLSRKKAEAMLLLEQAARKGNVAAIKAWNAELDKQRAAKSLRERERPPTAEKRGKKEERQIAAGAVASGDSMYAPPPAPRLAIDNT